MSTFTVSQELQTLTCASCQVLFAMPEKMYEKRRNDHAGFFCPAGHNNYFAGLSEKEKLQRQLTNEQETVKRIAQERDSARAEAEHFRKSRDGMKGALRKTCIRVKNGVCPCCKRTFSCLADHMKQKHPDYAVEPKEN